MIDPNSHLLAPAVPLTDDVMWLSESFALPDHHPGRAVHVSVYLVRSKEGWILIDSGSFYHRDRIVGRVATAIGDQPVRALILSHSDYPHSANISTFRRRWGDFEIIASCGNAEIQGLPYATRVPIGGSLEVAGRVLRFLDPPLADRSHTSWIYDESDRVMFVADGFGSYHTAADADLTSRELPQGISADAIHEFHKDTVVWLKYADPARMAQTFQTLFHGNPVQWVAPIHGHPIHETDLERYLGLLNESIGRIVTEAWMP